MNQTAIDKAKLLMRAAYRSGALDTAIDDIQSRLEKQFAEADNVAAWEVSQAIEELRRDPHARHLWPQQASGHVHAQAETQPQSVDWSKIQNPMARLTAWRAAEAAKQQ